MKNEIAASKVEMKETESAMEATASASKMLDDHRKAAAHHIEAAKHHLDAILHHERRDYGMAAESLVRAQGHHAIAGAFVTDDAKHHAQTLKVTHYHT